ncbi:solute carrier family 23 protein [Methanofollis formosanus]|uniref:solute carrier family 23 protein n=1 Tax=Methanofollis formosanus TaxID=299308 RepID=UPI001C7DEF9B|nr:solute carrier family 23 protein [Methanofollis formosanus]
MKLPDLVYRSDDRPPWSVTLVLAVQHLFLFVIGLQIVTALASVAGIEVNDLLVLIGGIAIAAGAATIVNAVGYRGAGVRYLVPYTLSAAYLGPMVLAVKTGGLSLLFGMTAVTGLVQVGFSRYISRLRRYFPVEIAGMILLMLGIMLISHIMPAFMGKYGAGSGTDIASVVTSVLLLGFLVMVYVYGRGMLRTAGIMLGICAGWFIAAATGAFGPAEIAEIAAAPLFAFPDPTQIGWSFDAALLLPFLVAGFCTVFNDLGTFTLCQVSTNQEWQRPDFENIEKGVLVTGLATTFSGLIGGAGVGASPAAVGVSIANGAFSRIIGVVTGVLLILIGCSPLLVRLMTSLPPSVLAAISLFAVSFIIVSGLAIISSRMLDSRRSLVIGVPLAIGVGIDLVSDKIVGMNDLLSQTFGISLTVAALLAILLNALYQVGVKDTVEFFHDPAVASPADVNHAMMRAARVWGARKEVFSRAVRAVQTCIKDIETQGLTEDPVRVIMRFDEFNLEIFVSYLTRRSGERGRLTTGAGRMADESDLSCRCTLHLHFDQ